MENNAAARRMSGKSTPKNDVLTEKMVLRAAGNIKPIQNQWLEFFLKSLPWVVLIGAFVVLFPGNLVGAPGPEMFGTGLLTVSVVLFAFQTLLDLVPKTLEALWHRELVAFRVVRSGNDRTSGSTSRSSSRELMEAYLAYVSEFESMLNSRKGQWGMVVAFELLTNIWLGFLNPEILGYILRGKVSILGWLELGINLALAGLIAPMAWRLVVIGLQIWRLPLKFDLKIQFEHPDRCGGLEPLGNLCLWNILIISLPLVFLGAWLLIARSDTSGFAFHETAWWGRIQAHSALYAGAFTKLLWVLVPFTILGFLLPLWNAHRVMVGKRRERLVRLDGRIKSIITEWNTVLEQIGDLTVAEGNERLGQLEFAHQIYQRQKNVPVWPINLNIFLKFASTQVVPLLSLTGLGPGLVRLLSLLFSLVSEAA